METMNGGMKLKYYRVKKDSAYQKDLQKAIKDQQEIIEVSIQVRKEFDLPENDLVSFSNVAFYQPVETLPEDHIKSFKKDGFAKKNSLIHKRFLEIIKEKGLQDSKDTRFINFIYGIMKNSSSQTLRRFWLEDSDYIESDVDFGSSELKHLEEITEIEFREIHLNALKEIS